MADVNGGAAAPDVLRAEVITEHMSWLEAVAKDMDLKGDHDWAQKTRAAILALLEQPEPAGDGWLPIKSAPKDGTIVLLWAYTEDEHDDAEYQERAPVRSVLPGLVSVQDTIWWSPAGGLHQVIAPTHWRPLPAPPSATEVG